MELAKQGRPPQPPSPSPSPSHRSAQAPYAPVPLPDDWGARAPRSCYLISPMSQQLARAGVSRPSAADLTDARPLNRVSLSPPQQTLSVQTGFSGVSGSQPSPPSTGKKTAMSPKVHMLKSPPSLLSADKSYVQKEPLPKSPQLDPVRSTFRESLDATLSTDSDQQTGQQSSANVSPVGSAGQNWQASGGRMQGLTAAFHGAGKDDDNVTKVAASRSQHSGMLCSNLGSNIAIKGKHDTQQRTEHVSFRNKFGNSTVALDGISQGHGLDIVVGASESMPQSNPKRAKMSDVHEEVNVSQIGPQSNRKITTYGVIEKKRVIHKDQHLASKIEKELFKLFGGANKKYKEKGRSLLFNLKDKNNPVLRERVLSGEMSPKCLCAMTIEELASKELSKWRVSKAEELAKRVVLPAMEVDVTRLVRKTHKGVFQVEVEETDAFPVEVGLGGNSRSDVTSKPIAVQTKFDDKTSVHREIKVTENRPWIIPLEVFMQFLDSESHSIPMDKAVGTWNSNASTHLEYPENEENRPWIVPLTEFMWVLDSEPHSKDQPIGGLQDDPNINKADKVNSANFLIAMAKAAVSEFQFRSDVPSRRGYCESKLESPINKPVSVLDPVEEPKGEVLVKSFPEKVDAEKSHAINGLTPESTMQCKITPDAALPHNSIWEGTIQLSLSSLTTIVAIFKSGEKPSTNEWRHFLEIKGTVRLSVLKEFLEQLPKSRSRIITVTELRWKEGSLESGRHHLLKAIDSYTADERVGLVKPAQEVDLYLCPSRGKACQILADHLPTEHLGSLIVPRTSIIGVVVWRRPHASSRVPSRQDGSKRQATTSSSRMISKPPSHSSNACRQEGVTADVPPGIGSGVVRDDDDLHQYNFASISNSAADATASQSSHRHLSHTSDNIEEQARELVHKYGDCDGDDDDMPERDPYSQGNLQQARIQQSHYPCQEYHRRLQYHPMRQYHHMTRPSKQHTAMPVRAQPLIYRHPMQPSQPSYFGLPNGGG